MVDRPAGEREWLVAADDRTGALEVAAGLAAHLGPTVVAVRTPADGSCVVDIGSRTTDAATAGSRAVAIDAVASRVTAHKIDSTLRGHWAREVTARCARSGRRLLVVAAWPEMGRTCIDGVVHVDGAAHDRLDRHLPGIEIVEPADVDEWLDGDAPMGAVDITDTDTLERVAADIARHRAFAEGRILLAAPAAPIAAVVGRTVPSASASASAASGQASGLCLSGPRPSAKVVGATLVVSGSATEVSASQLAAVVQARPDVEVFAPRRTPGPPRSSVAREVVRRAQSRLAAGGVGAVVVVGGSTAALLLGDSPRLVHGMAIPGLPWSTALTGDGPVVISKAGGFGRDDTLVAALDVLDSWR